MRQFIVILFFFTFLTGNAQENEIRFLIACGIAGSTSPEVTNIQNLAESEDYSALKKNLFAADKAMAILSAIALDQLEADGFISLSEKEKQKIAEISNWKDRYSVCYTCTQHYTGTITDLFKASNGPAYLLIRRTLVQG